MDDNEDPNLSDKVDIISTEDDRLKVIGEILSADSSRKILQLLFNQSFTANQIAQKADMSLPLVIHHLKKMQSVGVVKITNVGKNTKSHDMKFYTIDKVALVILPTEMKSPAKQSKSLFNSFNRIHRLATLGGACIAAWFSSQFLQKATTIEPQMEMSPRIESEVTMSAKIEPEMAANPMMEQVESDEMAGSFMADDAVSVTESVDTSVTTGEPTTDITLSVAIIAGIIVTWAIVEFMIRRRTKNKIKVQN